MATRYAVSTGIWNDVTRWDGGTTLPDVGDTVVANGFTVTIDIDVTVVEIRTLALGGGASGGGFIINNGITLTADVLAGTTTCLTYNGTSGNSANIVGNINGSVATSGRSGVSNASTGTLNITGTTQGGGASSTWAANNATTGIINLTGDSLGGTGYLSTGVNNVGNGTVNVTGNVSGSSGQSSHGITTVGPVNVTGNVTGGSGLTAYGLNSTGTGNITIVGDIYPGTLFGNVGVLNTTGGLHLEGNQYGVATGGQAGTVAISTRVLSIYDTAARKTEYAEASGAMPGSPTGYAGTIVTHYGAGNASGSTGQAAEADVRNGTVYGASDELTGTAYIPGASSVAAGVPVDATVGTAVLTAAGVAAACDVDGYTLEQALKLILSALAGKVSGAAAGAPIVFRAADDSKDRITATTDADGNRSAVTLDAAG